MRAAVLILLLAGCMATGGRLDDSGVPAPTPAGHAKLCAEQPSFPGCPK